MKPVVKVPVPPELARSVLARNEVLETFADFYWFLRSVHEGRFGRARKYHRDAVDLWYVQSWGLTERSA